MRPIRIVPARVDGDFRVPGSKSITNRALILGALAKGKTTLSGASDSDDTAALIAALKTLGFKSSAKGVTGAGGRIPVSKARLSVGNAGTTFRFLAAMAALGKGPYRIDGDARMRERPIGPQIEALRKLGASVRCAEREGFPPLEIEGKGLAGGVVAVRGGTSSQFLSALLMVAAYAHDSVTFEVVGELVSKPYLDLTIRMMADFGVAVKREGRRLTLKPATYRGRAVVVEPDAASAGYHFARAAVTGGRVRVAGLGKGCLQAEYALVDDLERMGCKVTRGKDFTEVRGGALRGIDADMRDRPDSAPTLACVALFAKGPTRIRNVAHLRFKESDRLAALARELVKVGARVVEHPDGIEIDPPAKAKGAEIETYKDHRMAMSFAVVGSAADGIVIMGPDVVTKSYPAFWRDWGAAPAPAAGSRRRP